MYRLNMTEVFAIEFISASRRPHGEDEDIDYVFDLLDISWWYYTIAILLGVVAWRIWKKPSLGLLIGYFFIILAETVLIRKPFTGQHFQPQLLWSWKQWNVQKNQILTNVVMFVPVGVLGWGLWRWRGLWVAAGMSVEIELFQLITARGLCEFDDVLHNVLGAIIGVGIVILVDKISRAEEPE